MSFLAVNTKAIIIHTAPARAKIAREAKAVLIEKASLNTPITRGPSAPKRQPPLPNIPVAMALYLGSMTSRSAA